MNAISIFLCQQHKLILCRFLYLRSNTPQNTHVWNAALQEYVLNGQLPVLGTTMLEHITTMTPENVQNQLSLLSSISNFHWWQYIRCDGKKSSKDICVNLTDHLLYHPTCEQHDDSFRLKYIPKSPRNRLMYYIYTDTVYPGALKSLIDQLLKLDSKEDTPFIEELCDDPQSSQPKNAESIVLTY